MEKSKLSVYASKKFVEFLKNKNTQNAIDDMIVWLNITSDEDIIQIYLTMFLAAVEFNKLSSNDLKLLKKQLSSIRSNVIVYPKEIRDDLPDLTDSFIKTKILEKAELV